ncbi:kinase-like protein [Thelephora ganbajun]|uniref:Kinase-like protein n=1 Tax=Thelephora ganbajun TaxID=370292 RepID=A0ACB6ZAC5_THEGA|nr:kinase-like protein [Thelephora ganbajun]
MDQHIHLLAEAMLATTVESREHNFVFPVIDVLDKLSSSSTPDPLLRWKCLLALGRVCSTYGILPGRYPWINNLVVFGDGPSDHGGSADVWRGEVEGCPVAVKVTRLYSTVPMARTREEILVWGRLSHPNILPFLGIDTKTFPLAAVSAWMQHGNLREYLVHFPSASRLNLLLDASRGLEYMHKLDYIHGDLKSFNVLIDDNHSARLADFGSSSVVQLPQPDTRTFPTPMGGSAFSVRWLAPELIYPEEFGSNAFVRSKESDIYALAMLMYEAFSGLLPFEGYRDEGVILQVMSGARPNRPQSSLDLGLTDGIWRMVQECWSGSDHRWTISCIVSCLESSIAPTPKMVGSDERTELQRPVSSALALRDGSAGASEPESEGIRPNRRKKLFRRLNQLFRI